MTLPGRGTPARHEIALENFRWLSGKELESTRHEAGIPANQTLVIDARSEHPPYQLRFIATPLGTHIDGPPLLHLQEQQWLLPWLIRVGKGAGQPVLEQRWVHNTGATLAIVGLDPDAHSDADVLELWQQGKPLISLYSNSIGRPMLSGHWRNAKSFSAEVDPLILQLRAEGKGETRQQVAAYMPATAWRQHDQPVSLHARVRRLERATKKLFGKTWDEYVRTVEQQS